MDWRTPRTIKVWPKCPLCELSSGVMKGKRNTLWYCKYCRRGFNEQPKEGVR